MEKYRFKKDDYFIEIEAPKEHAERFINKYYPTFKLVDNFI